MSSRQASRLSLFGRPKAIFDPAIKLHRTAYLEFLETGSWRNCSLSFVIDDDSLSLTFCIEKKLLSYYLKKEFGQDRNPQLLHRCEVQ